MVFLEYEHLAKCPLGEKIAESHIWSLGTLGTDSDSLT